MGSLPVETPAGRPCPGCPGFLLRPFPRQTPGPQVPSGVSPQSTADHAATGSLQDPGAPAPSPAPPRDMGPCMPLPGTYGCCKVCLRGFSSPFRRSQTSCFTLSLGVLLLCPLNSFPLSLQGRPRWDRAPASVPHPPRAGPGPLTLFLPHFLHPAEFGVVLYSLPVARCSCLLSSARSFCKIAFCVSARCLPEVSLETEELHTHLLLCRLIPLI